MRSITAKPAIGFIVLGNQDLTMATAITDAS